MPSTHACISHTVTRLWLVLTVKAAWQPVQGQGRELCVSPCPGAVGGSYDSVLLKEGDVKARPLRSGPQRTFHSL